MGRHCLFDPQAASDCVHAVHIADCDEILDGSAYDACSVWTDCDGDEHVCSDPE
jgi:hypothetical protein